MRAVLLEDSELGGRGEIVDVAKGYLRNYLRPRGLAAPATPRAVRAADVLARRRERAALEAVARAERAAALLSKTVLTIRHPAGADGRLFGSVTAQDVADAIREARGLEVDRRRVLLGEPIRTLGSRIVAVEFDGAVASVRVMVVPG